MIVPGTKRVPMPKTKALKRLEAEERQSDRELRSDGEQLGILMKRPGSSERERERLAQIQREIDGIKVSAKNGRAK